MDVQVLRNYVEIIESGSITAASKKLYIAQPALSLQLKSLEKELGTVLLIRSAHRLELTDAGRMLYRRAKHIVSLENSIKKDVLEYENGSKGSVRIGMTPSIALTVTGGILAEFCAAHPMIHCEIYEESSFEVLSLLDSGVINIGIIRTPCTLTADMNAVRYSGDSMAAVYSGRHFIFKGEGSLSVTDLFGRPVAIIRRYEQLIDDVFSSALRKSTDKAAEASLPEIKCVATELSTVIQWASAGLGIAIVPMSSFEAFRREEGLCCRVIDEPAFCTERIIVTKKNAPLSVPEKQLYDFALSRLQAQKK